VRVCCATTVVVRVAAVASTVAPSFQVRVASGGTVRIVTESPDPWVRAKVRSPAWAVTSAAESVTVGWPGTVKVGRSTRRVTMMCIRTGSVPGPAELTVMSISAVWSPPERSTSYIVWLAGWAAPLMVQVRV
jgi:hypothetical protein